MTLEIKSERNFTFGTGEPAVTHEKAVEIVKECVHLAELEAIKDTIDSVYGCDCAYYGVEGYAIAEALYSAGYHKQIEGENIGAVHPVDEFKCSVCGITLEGWTRVVTDEDDGELYYYEYEFRYCPNCGSRMKGGE